MSILGYSAAYFLPQYWVNTPLYGEKILPLLDYVLSTDYEKTELLATAFYNIESKYKNTADLPIECIEALIEESGYKYIRDLLGQDEDSLRVLVYLLVMIHQLKGSANGIKAVMELLRSPDDALILSYVGNPTVSSINEVSNFSVNDYVVYSNFKASGKFSINFQIRTGDNFTQEQCIASGTNYGFYLGIDAIGHLVLRLGQELSGHRSWQEIDGIDVFSSVRTLRPNTNYYITLSFDGVEYSVKVSTDGNKYNYYVTVPSAVSLDIIGGYVCIGVDKSTTEAQFPFEGEISLAPFTVSSDNVVLTQWFETLPVGEEDTFSLESEMDAGLISASFFTKFAKFVEKYVYPTLTAFRAKLSMKGKVTFLPYTRQRVTYVASNLRQEFWNYLVTELIKVGSPSVIEGIMDKSIYQSAQEAMNNYVKYYIGNISTSSTIKIKCKFTFKKNQGSLGGGLYSLKNSPLGAIVVPLVHENNNVLDIWGGISGGIRNFYYLHANETVYIETIDTYSSKTVNLYDANNTLIKTTTATKDMVVDPAQWQNLTLYVSQSSEDVQPNNSCAFDLNEFYMEIDGKSIIEGIRFAPFEVESNYTGYEDYLVKRPVED